MLERIGFFLLLTAAAILLLAVVFLWLPEEKEKRRKLRFAFIALLVTVSVVWSGRWLWIKANMLINPRPSQVAQLKNETPSVTVPEDTKQPETATTSKEVKEKQKGILVWSKPKGVNGGNANLRSFSTEAVIERNDSEAMEFTSTYKFRGEVYTTRFIGKRENNEICGEWHQELPKGGGEWCLKPKENDSKVWGGMVSDGSGTKIPLELKLS